MSLKEYPLGLELKLIGLVNVDLIKTSPFGLKKLIVTNFCDLKSRWRGVSGEVEGGGGGWLVKLCTFMVYPKHNLSGNSDLGNTDLG